MFFRVYLFIFFVAFLAFFLYRDGFIFTKRTGTHPFSILRTTKFTRHTLLEIIIGLEYITLAVIVIGYVFNLGFMDQLGRVPLLEKAWIKWLGVIDSWILVFFMFTSTAQMGSYFRVGIDEKLKPKLVTDGVFALTRNPIFFGILHMFLFVFLIVPNCLSLFLVFAFYIIVIEQIKEEERYLSSHLGEPYRRYLERVPRFFPRLRPFTGDTPEGKNN